MAEQPSLPAITAPAMLSQCRSTCIAGSYLKLIDFGFTQLKDLLGSVTKVEKKKKIHLPTESTVSAQKATHTRL